MSSQTPWNSPKNDWFGCQGTCGFMPFFTLCASGSSTSVPGRPILPSDVLVSCNPICNPVSFCASVTPLTVQMFSIESWESGSTWWIKSKETIKTNQSSDTDLYLGLTKGLCLFTPNEVKNIFQDDLVLGKVLYQAPAIGRPPEVQKKECILLLILFMFTLM